MKAHNKTLAFRHRLIALLGALMLTAPSAQAVVLSAEVFRDAAMRYEAGLGVEPDYSRAYRLYCVAALQGDSEAAYRLGLLHRNGHADLKADRSIAAGWFRLAAENGDLRSGGELEQLDGLVPAADPACPVVSGPPDRETIVTWVKLLAPEYGIDPRLVLALIAVESNFDARAVSPRNAHGLMQLLPATAARFAVRDIRDPVQNISGGLSYLRWLMEHYSGKVRLVLAAYNAGEHAVDDYDEKIPPYDETKRYVLRILVKYRKLFHPVDPLPITAAGFQTVEVAGNKVVMLTPDQAGAQ
jgi:TPR repeat protein